MSFLERVKVARVAKIPTEMTIERKFSARLKVARVWLK